MSGLTARFADAVVGSELRDERVLVAVSGGVDSTTLLSLLCLLREQQSLDIHVAHVDHGLRDDSATNAAFVKHLSERYNAPFHVTRVDVRGFADEKRCGIEAAARSLRYDFLKTADDQIETVLMNIARGGNTAALAGIPRQRSLTEGVRVLRPLLDFHRSDVENFARENALEWVEDSSNSEHVHLRNRVRHDLLPHMTSVLGPGIRENILRMSQTMKQLHGIIEQLADATESSLVNDSNETFLIYPEILTSTPPVISEAILSRHLHLTRADRMRLYGLVTSDVGTRASFSGGLQALRERQYIVVFRQQSESPDPVEFDINIDNHQNENTYQIGDRTLTVRLTQVIANNPILGGRTSTVIDLNHVAGRIRCRPWQSGDRIHLEGMSGSKLVSDVLTDAKIPHSMRRSIHVIADDEGILWICGLRSSHRAAVTDHTVWCLHCWIAPELDSD
jgi:tRNA(Ile)-lysidine synthase